MKLPGRGVPANPDQANEYQDHPRGQGTWCARAGTAWYDRRHTSRARSECQKFCLRLSRAATPGQYLVRRPAAPRPNVAPISRLRTACAASRRNTCRPNCRPTTEHSAEHRRPCTRSKRHTRPHSQAEVCSNTEEITQDAASCRVVSKHCAPRWPGATDISDNPPTNRPARARLATSVHELLRLKAAQHLQWRSLSCRPVWRDRQWLRVMGSFPPRSRPSALGDTTLADLLRSSARTATSI
jgi:hypothetical protein